MFKSRIHLYALGTRPGKREADHFGNYHLWTHDFDPETTTPQAAALACFNHWHSGIEATEADFSITTEYETTGEARHRYGTAFPEKVHVLVYTPHAERAKEINASFVDHLELHKSWYVKKVKA